MDQEKNLENSKKRLKVYYSLLVSVLCFIGVSFALFTLFLRQSDNNAVTALSCFTSTLTEENSAINLENEFPISDENGMKKTPFTFKLTNNCDNYVRIYITIDPLNEGTTNYILSKYIKANVSTKGSTDGTSLIIGTQNTKVLDNKHNGYIVKEVGLKSKESKEFDLRLWIDYDTTKEQAAGMTYPSQVVIVTEPGIDNTLAGTVLRNNKVQTPLTTPGRAVSVENEALLASTEDDYGTSYYFRGTVKNNYVQFANKCWRIVRITGDGSVKLVLNNDNTSNVSNPCSSGNDTAAFAHYDGTNYRSAFNSSTNDNAYVGFMYGTAGSSDYVSTHANINKSTILTNLETWYKNNLESYESKLADTIWCNDKSTFTTFTSGSTFGTGDGYGTNETGYGAYNRILGGKATSYANPSLICPNDNNGGKLSKFTVSDTINGNGNLTYKIGLLTADELAYAGYAPNLYSYDTTYLQENATGHFWWTMSPTAFSGEVDGFSVWLIFGENGNFICPPATVESGIRPAISLISSTNVTGEGTEKNPYIVE